MRMDKQKFVGVIIFFEDDNERKFLMNYDFENSWWSFYKVRLKDFKGEFKVLSEELKELGLEGNFIDYKDYLEIAPYGEIQQEIHLFLFKSNNLINLPDFKWMTLNEATKKLLLSDLKNVLRRVNHVLDEKKKL
ncbi:MAG: hypothetical protein PWP03_225 [Candidatus Woesearchaeota archaeon]|nr:hypothetical protein [Candidatus Woesearchaeota archaeon]